MMLLALTRESSLHSTVRLGWDEFTLQECLSFFLVTKLKKHYCLFLSPVLHLSANLIRWWDLYGIVRCITECCHYLL